MTLPVLALHQLSLAFDGQSVVSDVSFELRSGAIGALLGASGSGKSSLLRAIAGFVPPQSGHIAVDGVVVSSRDYLCPAHQRGIGLMFQDHALFPHLRVADNIAFGLAALSRSERKARVAELLALVGLEGLGQRWPHQLSGGQQQRVALARALAPKPRLLLLDEPFASLDSELRTRLASELRELLRAQRTTALLVTHDQQEAFAMADQVGVVAAGKLQQWASPYTLYHEPANRLVANFIGEGVFINASVSDASTLTTELGPLHCRYAHPHAPGTGLQVLLRPDDVVLDDRAGDGPRATIEARLFRGADFLYRLRLASGTLVLALVPSHNEHEIGEQIRIRLQADHVIAFPPTELA